MASYPTTAVQYGQKSSDVKTLQNFLISQGYSIKDGATGYFGDETKSALSQWQSANGIPSSTAGYGTNWGPKSIAAAQSGGGNQQSGSYINQQTQQSVPMGTASPGYNAQGQPISSTNIFNNPTPYQTQQTEQPQPDGSGGYTYQGKSYGAGTGPFASQFPVKKAQAPVKTTSNAQNTGSGASGTGSGTGTGSGSGTGSSTTTTPVLDQNTIDMLHYGGFTDQQISQLSAGDAANWAMTFTYLKKQSDLGATTASINAQTFNDAYTKAVNDPNIAAKYADLATTTAGDFANNLSQISLNAQLTSQQQQAQMQQAQANQEKQFGGAGTAYSSFRQGAQQQLNTSNQGVIQSTASQIQQQLRSAEQPIEQRYGTNYLSTLPQQGVSYLNPITGQNQQINYSPLGNITGTINQEKESDVLARQQQIYSATQYPVTK